MPQTTPTRRKKTAVRRSDAAFDQREPRLPHERDESSDSQGGVSRDAGRQAAADLAAGRTDTDRKPVLDATYERQKKPG